MGKPSSRSNFFTGKPLIRLIHLFKQLDIRLKQLRAYFFGYGTMELALSNPITLDIVLND
ncbi:hypothetical protein D9M68_464410 [compost metagenome]